MINIDYQSRMPIYEQIVNRFEMLIIKGVLQPDEQMPSVRALAVQLSLNPNTVQKAYTQLEQLGYIYPIKGRGNFVAASNSLVKQKKTGFFNDMQNLLDYGCEIGITMEECNACVEKYFKNRKDSLTIDDKEGLYD